MSFVLAPFFEKEFGTHTRTVRNRSYATGDGRAPSPSPSLEARRVYKLIVSSPLTTNTHRLHRHIHIISWTWIPHGSVYLFKADVILRRTVLRITSAFIMPQPLIGGALSDAFVWRLSVAYIRHNSRTERPRKTKIGDSDTTFKVKRSMVKVTRPLYSARPLRPRRLQRSAWERIFDVGNYCYVTSVRRRPRGGEGRGHIASHSLFYNDIVHVVQYEKKVSNKGQVAK